MRVTFLFFLACLCSLEIYSQHGDYSTDSTIAVGEQPVEGRDRINSIFCQVRQVSEVNRYTPYEVREYGLLDGRKYRIYKSKDILLNDTVQRVFLERLVEGKVTLYGYKSKGIKTYFIEKDSTIFKELRKKDVTKETTYNDVLLTVTKDCQNIKYATRLVSYNKNSLTKLISKYNVCDLKPFPHIRYGIIIGYEGSKLVYSDKMDSDIVQLDFKYSGALKTGAFIDYPILVSNLSMHSEIQYARHGYKSSNFSDIKDTYFIASTQSLKIPLLIRYVYPSNKIRPYINAGGIFTYHMKKTNSLYSTSINHNIVVFNEIKEGVYISSRLYGYSIGGGVEYKLNYRNSLFIEVRNNRSYASPGFERYSSVEYNILAGINF